jgi:hypothetical protein
MEYIEHFHGERNYQGKGTELLFSRKKRIGSTPLPRNRAVQRTTGWLTAMLRGPSRMSIGSDYYFG